MNKSLLRTAFSLASLALVAVFAQAESYALTNVRIVHADGSVIEGGMILISNDKIVHAGTPTDYEVGFVEIDCTGQTAYPGFINAYLNDGLDLPDTPENAEARDAGKGPLASFWHANRKGVYSDVDVAEHIDVEEFDSEDLFSQGVTAAMLASGRGAFGGRTAVVDMSGRLIAQRTFQEMSFRSGGGGGYPGSVMARIALMRQIMMDAEHYVAHPPTGDEEADLVLAATGDAVIGLTHTLFNANSEREIQRAFNLTDEFGLRLTINGGFDAWMHADALKGRSVSVILDPDMGRAPKRELSSNPLRALNEPPIEVLESRYQDWVEESKFAIKLHATGVKFAFSGDDMLDNVRKHIELGLPKEAALKALTSDAAEILGVSDQIGSLTKGKLANIVLMDGDFADAESKVTTVFVAGKKIDISTEEN